MKWLVVAGVLALAGGAATPAAAQPAPKQPSAFACSGPQADSARKIAKADNLAVGLDPQACFARMNIYGNANGEIVAVAPSAKCPGGKTLDVYGRSNAGSWYALFEKPVCGSVVSIGPKDQWGDWMLTVDGRHYDSRGAFYILVP